MQSGPRKGFRHLRWPKIFQELRLYAQKKQKSLSRTRDRTAEASILRLQNKAFNSVEPVRISHGDRSLRKRL